VIWPTKYAPDECAVISEVRFGVSASPPPVLPWKFCAKPQSVPEPPMSVTGVTNVTLMVRNVFAVVLTGPRSTVINGPAALLKTGVAPPLWVFHNWMRATTSV
jgi:hypothetical protein